MYRCVSVSASAAMIANTGMRLTNSGWLLLSANESIRDMSGYRSELRILCRMSHICAFCIQAIFLMSHSRIRVNRK